MLVWRWLIPLAAAIGYGIVTTLKREQNKESKSQNKAKNTDAEMKLVTRRNTELLTERTKLQESLNQASAENEFLRAQLQRYESQASGEQEKIKSLEGKINELQSRLTSEGGGVKSRARSLFGAN